MVGLKVYDKKSIDTSSEEFREKVSDSVKRYIKEHWDECVTLEDESDDKYSQYYIKVKL